MRSGGFGPASRSNVIYHHKVGRSERTSPSPAPRLRRPARRSGGCFCMKASRAASIEPAATGRYKSKCVSRWSPAASTSRNAFLHFAHAHRCVTWGTRVLAGTSCTSVDAHAGHFLSVLMGISSAMFTSPSANASPRCRGGTSLTRSPDPPAAGGTGGSSGRGPWRSSMLITSSTWSAARLGDRQVLCPEESCPRTPRRVVGSMSGGVPRRRVALQERVERGRVHWLGEVGVEACRARAQAIFALPVSRHGDEDHVSEVRGSDALGDLIAVETGETEIDDDGVRVKHQRLLEAPDAVFRLMHLIARQLEQVAQHLTGIGVVFDDQNAPVGAGRKTASGASSRRWCFTP